MRFNQGSFETMSDSAYYVRNLKTFPTCIDLIAKPIPTTLHRPVVAASVLWVVWQRLDIKPYSILLVYKSFHKSSTSVWIYLS